MNSDLTFILLIVLLSIYSGYCVLEKTNSDSNLLLSIEGEGKKVKSMTSMKEGVKNFLKLFSCKQKQIPYDSIRKKNTIEDVYRGSSESSNGFARDEVAASNKERIEFLARHGCSSNSSSCSTPRLVNQNSQGSNISRDDLFPNRSQRFNGNTQKLLNNNTFQSYHSKGFDKKDNYPVFELKDEKNDPKYEVKHSRNFKNNSTQDHGMHRKPYNVDHFLTASQDLNETPQKDEFSFPILLDTPNPPNSPTKYLNNGKQF